LRLRAANQQVARGQHVIETIDARRQALRGEQARALGVGMTAAELRFGLQCEAELLRLGGNSNYSWCGCNNCASSSAKSSSRRGATAKPWKRCAMSNSVCTSKKLRGGSSAIWTNLFLLRREYLRRS